MKCYKIPNGNGGTNESNVKKIEERERERGLFVCGVKNYRRGN